jgi:hypothetical protein
MKAHQQLQFQTEQLYKQFETQFNSLLVLISSLPDFEDQDFFYTSLYGNTNSLKRKGEDEEQKYDCSK